MRANGWRRTAALITGFALTAVMAAGCGEEAVVGTKGSNDTPELAIDLDQPTGGMDDGNEAPGYGDTYFQETLAADEPVNDRLAEGQPPVVDRPGASVFLLRATWGRMTEAPVADEGERPDCGSLSWDGGLAVSDGGIAPVGLIRFERAGDYADALVLPREDRTVLEWTSTTGCGQDGVLALIVVPPAGNDSADAAHDGLTSDDMVTFSIPGLGIEEIIPIQDLAELDLTVMVDENNGYRLVGFDRDDLGSACRRGVILGGWVRVPGDENDGGYFRASWLNPRGDLLGYSRGRWGETEDGEPRFVGKLISESGQFAGFVRGAYGATGRNGGWFRGQWFVVDADSTERHLGVVHGEWHDRMRGPDSEGGSMRGVWRERCNPHVDEDGEGDAGDGGDTAGGGDTGGNGQG